MRFSPIWLAPLLHSVRLACPVPGPCRPWFTVFALPLRLSARLVKAFAQMRFFAGDLYARSHAVFNRPSGRAEERGLMATCGYAWIWSKEQNVRRQIDALRAFPLQNSRICVDRCTGATFERLQYRALMRRLHAGDVMVRKAPRSRRMYCYLRAREVSFRIRVQLNGIAEGAVLCCVHFVRRFGGARRVGGK